MKLVLTALGILTLVGLGFSLIVPTGSARLQQSEKETATPIQEGIKSERQKEHSKLYKEYKTDKKLTDMRVPGTNDVRIGVGTGFPMGDPSDAPFDRSRFLKRLACDADAVVMGVVRNKTSQLTEDEGFIFSDYDFVADEILKPNTAAPIQVTEAIIITRPGGAVRINDRVFQAEDESFKPLSINGRYILFLRYIPATGAYQAINSKAAFRLVDERIEKLTMQWTGFESENGAAQFLRDVQAAVSACREEKGAPK